MPKAASAAPLWRGAVEPRGVEESAHAWNSIVGTWEVCGPPRLSCRGRVGKERIWTDDERIAEVGWRSITDEGAEQ